MALDALRASWLRVSDTGVTPLFAGEVSLLLMRTIVQAVALALLLSSSSCRHVSLSPDPGEDAARVSLAEATALVRTRIFEDRPDMNPSVQAPLAERTTDEMWDRLGVQLFVVTEGVAECESFLVRRGRVHSFCGGFGGHGIQSACVTDLDSDGEPELTYTYSWGSGIHRSLVGVSRFVDDELRMEDAEVAYVGDLFVRKESDALAIVEIGEYGWEFGAWNATARFGEVELAREGDRSVPRVRLAELSEEHAGRIWE